MIASSCSPLLMLSELNAGPTLKELTQARVQLSNMWHWLDPSSRAEIWASFPMRWGMRESFTQYKNKGDKSDEELQRNLTSEHIWQGLCACKDCWSICRSNQKEPNQRANMDSFPIEFNNGQDLQQSPSISYIWSNGHCLLPWWPPKDVIQGRNPPSTPPHGRHTGHTTQFTESKQPSKTTPWRHLGGEMSPLQRPCPRRCQEICVLLCPVTACRTKSGHFGETHQLITTRNLDHWSKHQEPAAIRYWSPPSFVPCSCRTRTHKTLSPLGAITW